MRYQSRAATPPLQSCQCFTSRCSGIHRERSKASSWRARICWQSLATPVWIPHGWRCVQEAEEACQLVPLRIGGLLLLLLLHPQLSITASTRQQLADSIAAVAQPLSTAISTEVAAAKGWHVKGFRCER